MTSLDTTIINRTIRALCEELEASLNERTDWTLLSEDDLLYELAVCMFSSQAVFETAVATANRLRSLGLLSVQQAVAEGSSYSNVVLAVLSEPIPVKLNGKIRELRPRFKNRYSSMLAHTIAKIHARGDSLQRILISARSAAEARQTLTEVVYGFGPKQASLFLRRIGYCSDLAVLDTHVLDYLRLAHGTDPKRNSLSRLQSYEQIETEFRAIANAFGHSVGCVDLATWVTMRVAKREEIP